jgi:hypothetical protein
LRRATLGKPIADALRRECRATPVHKGRRHGEFLEIVQARRLVDRRVEIDSSMEVSWVDESIIGCAGRGIKTTWRI